MDDYLIEYSIQRRIDGEDDFTEIGFGSSGTWSDVDQAVYMVESDIQNRMRETSDGIPDPRSVDEED